MNSFGINALGLEEMSLQESKQTNGGSIVALVILAIVAVCATSCTVQVNIENGPGDQHVGDEHGSGDENTAELELIPV